MTQRRRLRIPSSLSLGDIKELKACLASPNSSILIAEAHGIKTSSKDFAVDLLDVAIKSEIPAIWALPEDNATERLTTIEEILASLVLQTIEQNRRVLSEGTTPLSVKHFKTIGSLDGWLQLLRKSIEGLKYLLVVVDLMMIQNCLKRNYTLETEDFLEKILEIAKSMQVSLKIVGLKWKLDDILPRDQEDSTNTHWIFTDLGPRKVRLMRNPKYRAIQRARRQKFALELREGLWTSSGDSTNHNDMAERD